jgi:DNA-binding IclR family transcriptional regulator
MANTPSDAPLERSRRIAAVDRAIDVISMLSHAGADLSLTTIANYVGMSKSAAYELMRTLESRRIVERDADTRRYRLSWTMYEIGATVLHRVALPSAAGYYLDLLAVQTGQHALLGIMQSHSVLYLARGEARPGLSAFANVGRRFPLHSTASGKVLLAFHQDSSLMERILHSPLERVTDRTIVDPQTLRTEIARARMAGYATCWQEGERDLCSVAMPVRDHLGRTVAALALVGSADSLTPSTVQRLIRPLNSAVRAVEARLGLVAGSGTTDPGAPAVGAMAGTQGSSG